MRVIGFSVMIINISLLTKDTIINYFYKHSFLRSRPALERSEATSSNGANVAQFIENLPL